MSWRPEKKCTGIKWADKIGWNGGDKNTSFFHTKANQRRERNNIDEIKDAAGNLFIEEEDIVAVMVFFFKDLLSSKPIMEKITQKMSNDLQVAKVLTSRLRLVVRNVIDESQSAFVGDGLITDNVVVAYELFDWQKSSGIYLLFALI